MKASPQRCAKAGETNNPDTLNSSGAQRHQANLPPEQRSCGGDFTGAAGKAVRLSARLDASLVSNFLAPKRIDLPVLLEHGGKGQNNLWRLQAPPEEFGIEAFGKTTAFTKLAESVF